MLTRVKEFITCTIQYACIMHCTFEYVGDFVVCNGPSMEPTLYTKNILLTERVTARLYKPRRGSIIIARSPLDPNQYICKRIVAIPGDQVLIDTIENSEIAKFEKCNTLVGNYVPRGHVWIEGDNSKNSADSRAYGPIPVGLIKSRVVCRLWPLSNMAWLF